MRVRKYVVVVLLALATALVSTVAWFSIRPSFCLMSDAEARAVLGGAVDCGCQKRCVTEPDCKPVHCAPYGSGKCPDYNDYWWSEQNTCEDSCGSGSVDELCIISDSGKCLEHTVCNKNPVFSCDYSARCDDWHATGCNHTDIWAYDDCDTMR